MNEIDDEPRRSDNRELHELADPAPLAKPLKEAALWDTHATQYQAAKSTVNNPSSGREKAT